MLGTLGTDLTHGVQVRCNPGVPSNTIVLGEHAPQTGFSQIRQWWRRLKKRFPNLLSQTQHVDSLESRLEYEAADPCVHVFVRTMPLGLDMPLVIDSSSCSLREVTSSSISAHLLSVMRSLSSDFLIGATQASQASIASSSVSAARPKVGFPDKVTNSFASSIERAVKLASFAAVLAQGMQERCKPVSPSRGSLHGEHPLHTGLWHRRQWCRGLRRRLPSADLHT